MECGDLPLRVIKRLRGPRSYCLQLVLVNSDQSEVFIWGGHLLANLVVSSRLKVAMIESLQFFGEFLVPATLCCVLLFFTGINDGKSCLS